MCREGPDVHPVYWHVRMTTVITNISLHEHGRLATPP